MLIGLKVDRSEASKAFFSEEKKQKTFVSAAADLSGESATAETKAFWFFFSKKNCFLPYPSGVKSTNAANPSSVPNANHPPSGLHASALTGEPLRSATLSTRLLAISASTTVPSA